MKFLLIISIFTSSLFLLNPAYASFEARMQCIKKIKEKHDMCNADCRLYNKYSIPDRDACLENCNANRTIESRECDEMGKN
jgi:hypothetical protein